MEITLGKVVEAARQRRAAVTAEVGGYIVLLATQRLAKAPGQVAPEGIGLNATGEISLAPSPPNLPLESEIGLRRLLSSLLGLSQSAPPALRAAAERSAVGDLAALEAELTAALIPINHAAAGRALARLFRETQRAFRSAAASAEGAEASSPAPSSVSALESGTAPAVEEPRESIFSRLLPRRATSTPAAAAAPSRSPAPAFDARATTPAPASAALVEHATLPAPVSAAQLPVAAELEIEVDIVLGESMRGDAEASGAADPEISHDDVELSAAEPSDVELSVAELDVAAAVAAVAEPVPAAVTPAAAAGEPVPATPAELSDELDELLSEVTPTTPAPPLVAAESSADDELAHSPAPDATPPPDDFELAAAPQRSDLRELLNSYLSYTRCEEHMTADLRRMIGLEPWRAAIPLDSPKMGP